MAIQLLRTTSLKDVSLLRLGEQAVLQQHDRIASLLRHADPLGHLSFAEPIVTWSTPGRVGHVAWYYDVDDEEVPIDGLGGDDRQHADSRLRDALDLFMRSLDADVDARRLVEAALVLLSADSILIAHGQIVLVDWGLIPSGTEPPALAQTPLGPFLSKQAETTPAVVHSPTAKAENVGPLLAPRRYRSLLPHLLVGFVFLLLGLAAGLRLMNIAPWVGASAL